MFARNIFVKTGTGTASNSLYESFVRYSKAAYEQQICVQVLLLEMQVQNPFY